MFVFFPGSIHPMRFGQAGTVPAEISIPAVYFFRGRGLKNENFFLSEILVIVSAIRLSLFRHPALKITDMLHIGPFFLDPVPHLHRARNFLDIKFF